MRSGLRETVAVYAVRFAILVVSVTFAACSEDEPNQPNQPVIPDSFNPSPDVHILFGIPFDADPADDYIIRRRQYVVSYSDRWDCPNWVSWQLSDEWYGDVPRYEGIFMVDDSLPPGMHRVQHSDYTNSNYDRGHLVRSEERTRTADDNRSTFIMTNILPQRPDLNRGVWLDLEYWCESMCKDSMKVLYVIAGGVFFEPHNWIHNSIAVPDSCFKIIVVMDKGKGLSDVTASTRVVAVMMPNIDGIRNDEWEKYQCSVDEIELLTGYDFLDRLPNAIEEILER